MVTIIETNKQTKTTVRNSFFLFSFHPSSIMDSLALQFAKTLLKLGYPGYKTASELAEKVGWVTEFEKPRILIAWICENLGPKNALSKDQLVA